MVEITQGTEADVGAVVGFAPPILRELGLESTPAAILDTAYRRYLGRAECLWIIAREHGKIVGTLIAQVRGGGLVVGLDGFVEAIAVAPGSRGRGVGLQLLDAAEVWAATHGAAAMHLMIPATSPMKVPQRYGAVETWYRKELRHG